MEMNDYEKGWISALIDSEGCLDFARKGEKCPRVRICNTNFVLLSKAQQLLGGILYHSGGTVTTTAWDLDIHFKYWKAWLKDIPLIEKENMRQKFLLWQITKVKWRKNK